MTEAGQTETGILLVEDEAADAALFDKMIRQSPGMNCSITHVSDLAGAVSALQAGKFDIIILDLFLPDCSGVESFQRVHNAGPGVPVIVLTGLYDRELGVRTVQEGAEDYLVKGEINRSLLARAIRYAIERHGVKRAMHELNAVLEDRVRERTAELEKAIDALRRNEANMLKAQKYKSLAALAGGVAHDFNNLLTVILGNAELALVDKACPESIAEGLREIKCAGHRASDLCRKMLAYSGKGRFITEPLDLCRLIDGTVARVKLSLSPDTEVCFGRCPQLPAIEGDAAQLEQMMTNLLVNAAEAIGAGAGRISITTGTSETISKASGEVILQECPTDGRYVYLSVEDTGCGMDIETRRRIFEPFFTTKFAGRGLGLAAILGIVRGHRGAIVVHSEPGKGARFEIFLPVAERQLLTQTDEIEISGDFTFSGTILLADDEGMVREVGRRLLERLGFQVVLAVDGIDAVERFRGIENAGDGRITCVILDMTMPNLDGPGAFAQLRSLRADVPIILSSGYSEHEVRDRFQGAAISGFLHKPYQADELARELRHVITLASNRSGMD